MLAVLVATAAKRVLQSWATLGITRGNQFPFASAGEGLSSRKNAKFPGVTLTYIVNAERHKVSVIWHLDFWGKHRRDMETIWESNHPSMVLHHNGGASYLQPWSAKLKLVQVQLSERFTLVQINQTIDYWQQ